MTSRPLLSVVVADVSSTRFLPRLFRSLESQTTDPADLEVVVADDGVVGSPAEAQRWAHRLAVADFRFLSVPCPGLPGPMLSGAARNVAMAEARGRFLICMDPRDIMAPTLLARCLDVLETTGADLACPGWRVLGRGSDGGLAVPVVDPALLARRDVRPPVALMRREVWEAGRGYALNTIHMDWDFWIQAALNGFRAVAVPGVLLERRLDEAGAPGRDGRAKAALVRNNRAFFHPEVVAWAGAVEHGESWAETMSPGLLPGVDDVRAMRSLTAVRARAQAALTLDAAARSVSSAPS